MGVLYVHDVYKMYGQLACLCVVLLSLSVFAAASTATEDDGNDSRWKAAIVSERQTSARVARGQSGRGIADGPLNEAGLVGSTVVMRCEAGDIVPNVRILWYEFAHSPFGNVISDNVNITSHPERDRYRIIHGRDTQFDLEISNLRLEDGGMYLCGDVNDNPPNRYYGQAELVVLGSHPQCRTTISPDGSLIELNFYAAECMLEYSGGMAPLMSWTGPEPFSHDYVVGETTVSASMTFYATRGHESAPFSCRTNFTEKLDQPPEHASNAPSYENTYSTAPITVFWPPTDALIIPIRPAYVVGDVVTCITDGNPEPAYQWTNMRTLDQLPPGQNFVVNEDMVGFNQSMRCHASNVILGIPFTINVFADVYVPEPTTTPPSTVPPTTTPPPADGPCNDLTGRWASSSPLARICLDVDAKGNMFVLIQNGTDIYFVLGRGKTVIGNYAHVGFTAHWPQTGVGAFAGECHNCFGTEVLLMSGLSRNKHAHDVCGESSGTQLTPLYVFTRVGLQCVGMEVDEVRTNQPWIVEKLGVKAKKIRPL
jgi:hypothetical protein